ncbi:MAG: YkgJ family cysteine cluster protein [Myxococcales bacterium]|nr:YkgJ family cysteine cluster protein [Myxococcales bacterium]
MQSFFTFSDRALKYDCPSCGSFCCKGKGVALEARDEVVRFARLEPRMASLVYPLNSRFAQIMDVTDGCWMLRPDGLCSIETDHGYDDKPHTCRFFPFNRIFQVGDVRVVDFNSKICPLTDSSEARNGQSWADLQKQIDAEGPTFFGRGDISPPEGAIELGWAAHEQLVRDAIDAHLDEPDYAAFAAFQEEAMIAVMRRQPMPAHHSPQVLDRAEYLRSLLESWRVHHGVAGDPRLADAARTASRQAALLTCSWRLSMILNREAGPYPGTIQMLPRHLLAAAHLLEAAHVARRTAPGLRAATELFQGASPLIGVLSLFLQKAHIAKPLDHGVATDVQPALDALSRELLKGGRTLAETAQEALSPFPAHLRSMALSALAFGNAELVVE